MEGKSCDLKSLPKIELHAHLSGSLSDECLKKLISSSNLLDDDISRLLQPLEKKNPADRNMAECFELFAILHRLTINLEAVKQMTEYTINEFRDDAVIYLELRTTPKSVPGSYTKSEYIRTVLDTIIDCSASEDTMMVRLLISIDRSRGLPDAKDALRLAKELSMEPKYKEYVVGIDVSGDPQCGSLKDYIPVLKEAKQANFKITAHLVEISTDIAFEEAYELINLDLVDRIGHGTFIHPKMGGNAQLYEIVRSKNIPLEICITSNIICGTVDTVENHHVKYWKEENHPFVICTDDKGVFGTSLTKELETFRKVFDASHADLWNMGILAANATFLPKADINRLQINIEKYATTSF